MSVLGSCMGCRTIEGNNFAEVPVIKVHFLVLRNVLGLVGRQAAAAVSIGVSAPHSTQLMQAESDSKIFNKFLYCLLQIF